MEKLSSLVRHKPIALHGQPELTSKYPARQTYRYSSFLPIKAAVYQQRHTNTRLVDESSELTELWKTVCYKNFSCHF
jgi:hypothetical protein